jgi:hypothetical protein
MKNLLLISFILISACAPVTYPKAHSVCIQNLKYCDAYYTKYVARHVGSCELQSFQYWRGLCAADYDRCENNFR